MKKFLTLILVTLIVPQIANAQGIQAQNPASMQGNGTPAIGQMPRLAPAQQASNNADLNGYSVVFLAYHYNDYCKLGIPRATIDTLAGELKKAEAANQITPAVINQNVEESKKLFREDPVKFCADAKQIATVIQGMFMGGGIPQIPQIPQQLQ